MNLESILCVCLAVVTLTLANQSQDGVQSNGDASYEFGYDIHNPLSNDIKSHHEVRDGKNVLGFYTFREADGSIRVVKYKVTPDSGFQAVVEKLPDPLAGNSIDGQVAAPSTHGVPATISEPNGGANSQYVAGRAGFHNVAANRNARGNTPEPQRAPVPDQRQRHIQTPQQHHHPGERYRNPHIIRRNPRFRDEQQSRVSFINQPFVNQRFAQETRHVDSPRRRQQQSLQERGQPRVPQGNNRNHFGQTNGQGSGKIVYIDGVAYIDDIGLYSDSPDDGQQQQNPQYEVVENPEGNAKDEAATNSKETEADEEKEDYEEEDEEDEDEDSANYEEEDGEEDEDVDASDFYEENDKLINEHQEEYDRLKKAYEEDGQKPKANNEKQEEDKEKQPEPVQEQQ